MNALRSVKKMANILHATVLNAKTMMFRVFCFTEMSSQGQYLGTDPDNEKATSVRPILIITQFNEAYMRHQTLI